ncbi:hypothetical protein [Clostridioides difficile]
MQLVRAMRLTPQELNAMGAAVFPA